jgi:hypothetical protein
MGSAIVELSQFVTRVGTDCGDEILNPVYRGGLPAIGLNALLICILITFFSH